MTLLDFDVIWRDQGASKGLRDLAAGSKTAERGFGDMASSADKAAAIIRRAQLDQAGATRKVAIEEAKLKELRDSGKAKASQILAAEDRLAHARQKVADATETAAHAAKDLGRAEDGASGKAGKARGAFAQAFSHLKIPNPFSSLSGEAKHEGKIAGDRFGGAFKSGLRVVVGAAAVLGGLSAAKTLLNESIGEARESQKVGAVSTQIIKATGGAAKISADQLGALTTAISNKTGVDDEAIQSGSNLLLTFKNVRNEVGDGANIFDRATQAAVDLSAAGFGSIAGGSKMLGKALNDPIKGISALSRAGVTFTQQQKDQISTLVKSGDVLGAQKIILKEVESQVGGVAEKSATAGEKLKTVADNTKEAVGTAFLPLLDQSENLIAKVLPGVGSALSGAVGGLSKWVSKNKGAISETFGAISSTLKSFSAIAGSWLKPFTSSLTGGRNTFKNFADFLGTHQEDITRGLIAGARFTISFAEALSIMASAGLRAFAFLMDAQANMTAQMLGGFKLVIHGAALAFGWIPGVGDKLKTADEKFDGFATGVVTGMHKAADGARGLADGIDTKMTPALKAARAGLDKMAKQQIWDAQKRDQAERARIAIEGIGTKANGSQIKLKKFSDITKLSGTEQAALKGRLSDASHALGDQLTAMKKAHAGQGELTKAWKTGRDRLYDEFKQMGLSKTEAGRLADKYAGVKPKVKTKFEQPGMDSAKENARKLRERYKDIPDYVTTKIKFDTWVDGHNAEMTFKYGKGAVKMVAANGAVLPGFTPGRDVHRFVSPTGGELNLSGGEAIMVPEWTKAVGGPGAVSQMNRAARSGQSFASGGVFGQVMEGGSRLISQMGAKAVAAELKKAAGSLSGGAGGPIGSIDVSKPRGLTSYEGGTFTNLFASNLRRAEQAAGRHFQIYQGGFRPTTSYSGSTHNMDAIDARVDYILLKAFRKYVGAIGDRTGLGNWMSHMHGVPAPGHGYGAPQARWQYQDYLKRGGASQSPKSPWGLAGGGVMVGVAERGPERILTTRQNHAFENLVRSVSNGGGAVVNNHYHLHADHYVGNYDDLARALVKMNQHGRLDVIKRG
jgi:hypothetical protein